MIKTLKSPSLWITAILSAIVLTVTTGYVLFKLSSLGGPLMVYLYQGTSYEYELNVPDYWQKVDTDGFDVSFTGNNYENIYMNFKDKPSTYDFNTYGSQLMIQMKNKYPDFKVNAKIDKKNTYNIYMNEFDSNDYHVVVGFVDNKDFITEFEYRIDSKNDINKNLEDIISSTKRFKLEEVSSNGSKESQNTIETQRETSSE